MLKTTNGHNSNKQHMSRRETSKHSAGCWRMGEEGNYFLKCQANNPFHIKTTKQGWSRYPKRHNTTPPHPMCPDMLSVYLSSIWLQRVKQCRRYHLVKKKLRQMERERDSIYLPLLYGGERGTLQNDKKFKGGQGGYWEICFWSISFNTNLQTAKGSTQVQFSTCLSSQEWLLPLLNWWNSVYWWKIGCPSTLNDTLMELTPN